jgi:hypothetical protein
LLVTSLVQTDAVAKLLIEKGVITQDEFMEKIKAEEESRGLTTPGPEKVPDTIFVLQNG